MGWGEGEKGKEGEKGSELCKKTKTLKVNLSFLSVAKSSNFFVDFVYNLNNK